MATKTRIPYWLKDTPSVPGSNGTARTRKAANGSVVLFVRFGAYEHQYKWRDVGIYESRAAAHRAFKERSYGF